MTSRIKTDEKSQNQIHPHTKCFHNFFKPRTLRNINKNMNFEIINVRFLLYLVYTILNLGVVRNSYVSLNIYLFYVQYLIKTFTKFHEQVFYHH